MLLFGRARSMVTWPQRLRIRRPGRATVVAATTAAIVVLPCIAAIGAVVGSHWNPASDVALELLRVEDVFGHHTPLVGAQSRSGYSHPGPMLFWYLAPFDRAFGSTGVLVATGLLNAGAVAGALLVAGRLGRLPLLAFTALALAVLCRGLGPGLLVDPWNPWVAVLPFFLVCLLAWAVAEADWVLLPALVGVGSFVAQAHLGYAPLVFGLSGVGLALGLLRRWRRTRADGSAPSRSLRRPFVVSGVVAAALWAGPVMQQLISSRGNLRVILDSVSDPAEPIAGWTRGLGIMAHQLGVPPPLVTGDEANSLGFLVESSVVPLAVLATTVAVLALVARSRDRPRAMSLAVLALTGGAVGIVGAARIVGVTVPYLVRWAWVLAALLWLSLAWSAWVLLRERPRVARVVLATVLVAAVVLSVGTTRRAMSADVPEVQFSEAIAALAPRVARQLDSDAVYRIAWVDSLDFYAVATGLLLALREDGYDVRMDPAFAHAVGRWRTAGEARAAATLTVISDLDERNGWPPPDDALIAHFDPLRPSQRRTATALERRVVSELHAPPTLLGVVIRSEEGRGGAGRATRGPRRDRQAVVVPPAG